MYNILTVTTCDSYPVLEYSRICSRFEVCFSSEQLNKPYSRSYNLYQSCYSLPVITPVNIFRLPIYILSHTIVDAYCSCYARHVYNNGLVSARLIVAKSRVAPLPYVSIPRLELMAAVLGLRLALSVRQALYVSEEHLVFWSDSMNVVHWIRGKNRDVKPFVSNRIGDTIRSSNPKQSANTC